MTKRMPGIALLLLAFSLVFVPAERARAMNCSQWVRLSEQQKYQTIARMIDDTIAGKDLRQYDVNRYAIGRCLNSQRRSIFYTFSDSCENSHRAGMRKIDIIFKRYIWSCLDYQ